MAEPLDIAVGVLVDAEGRILIARRRAGTPGAGYWEFPGGKREAGEAIFDCLNRELSEEIGVTELSGAPLIRFAHARGPRPVRLHVWRIHDWTGELGGLEGQSVRWVVRQTLDALELLPASEVILAALRLPRRYLITPAPAGSRHEDWLAALDRALVQGIRLLRLHAPELPDDGYEHLARRVLERAHARDAAVLLERQPEQVAALGADGLHRDAANIASLTRRPVSAGCWFAVSAQDEAGLAAALAAGADFATLAPVAPTTAQAGAEPFGWPGFENRRGDRALPVYALGGLGPDDQSDALAHNAQGIAAMRGLWPGHG